jgi:hypothetical protein
MALGDLSNPYGSIPGAIGLPSSSFAELGSAYPNLGGSTGQASADIMKELQGQLSPEALANLQRSAAQFGVSSGMPGSGLQTSKNLLGNVLTTEDLQHQGIGDYLSTVTGLSKIQLDPSLAAEIAARNSNVAAAPNPAAAAQAGQNSFMRGLGLTRGGGGNRLPQLGSMQPDVHFGYDQPAALGPLDTGANQVITNYLPGTTTPAPGGTSSLFDYNTTSDWGETGGGGTPGSSYFGPAGGYGQPGAGTQFDVPDFNNPQTPFDPNQDYFGLPQDNGAAGGGDPMYDLSSTG